jgi:type II secretory pathway pseudopilin PulG
MTTRKDKRPRAYLMLETLIGSAIIAVILGTLITHLAGARRQASANSHETVATYLLQTKADEIVAGPHIIQTQAAFIPVDEVRYPGFRWRWSSVQVPSLQNASIPPLRSADTLHEVVVELEYPGARNLPVTRQFRRYKVRQ